MRTYNEDYGDEYDVDILLSGNKEAGQGLITWLVVLACAVVAFLACYHCIMTITGHKLIVVW